MDLERSLMHLASGFLRWSMDGGCARKYQLNSRMDLERCFMYCVWAFAWKGAVRHHSSYTLEGFGTFFDASCVWVFALLHGMGLHAFIPGEL